MCGSCGPLSAPQTRRDVIIDLYKTLKAEGEDFRISDRSFVCSFVRRCRCCWSLFVVRGLFVAFVAFGVVMVMRARGVEWNSALLTMVQETVRCIMCSRSCCVLLLQWQLCSGIVHHLHSKRSLVSLLVVVALPLCSSHIPQRAVSKESHALPPLYSRRLIVNDNYYTWNELRPCGAQCPVC